VIIPNHFHSIVEIATVTLDSGRAAPALTVVLGHIGILHEQYLLYYSGVNSDF
jgi:hypothetical protein